MSQQPWLGLSGVGRIWWLWPLALAFPARENKLLEYFPYLLHSSRKPNSVTISRGTVWGRACHQKWSDISFSFFEVHFKGQGFFSFFLIIAQKVTVCTNYWVCCFPLRLSKSLTSFLTVSTSGWHPIDPIIVSSGWHLLEANDWPLPCCWSWWLSWKIFITLAPVTLVPSP